MSHLLPDAPLFLAFLAASIVLAVTPGPGVLYVVTRTLAQGRRTGLISVAGVAVGNLGNALAASAGLAALFAVSSTAFSIVKYAGAVYIVYLGVQMLRSAGTRQIASAEAPPASRHRVFRDGFVVALFNPKTTLFYAAFLPQFVTSSSSPMFASMVLATIFVAIAAATDAMYALAAGLVVRFAVPESSLGRAGRFGGGITFVGLGLYTAFTRIGGHD